MSLSHILLGFLAQPASGYHLKQAFGDSVRHFWDAELSQIYPALHALHRRGWVSRERMKSAQGPAQVVYRRTPRGQRELQRWLRAAPVVPTQRLPYLAQIYFLGQSAGVRDTRRALARLRAKFQAQRSALAHAERLFHAECPGGVRRAGRGALHAYLTLRLGLTTLAARMAWCDESLALLKLHKPGARRRG